MTVLNFAGMLGMVVPQSCASRKKRLMTDHGNHVHASIIFVDSCLRIARVVLSDPRPCNQHAACYDISGNSHKDVDNSDGPRECDLRQTVCGR